jgi:hypothetical protein
MRTTLNLPDDIYEAARSVAAAKKISLGEAVGELVRQGLRPPLELEREPMNGLLVPRLPQDSPVITLEHTLAIEDDID